MGAGLPNTGEARETAKSPEDSSVVNFILATSNKERYGRWEETENHPRARLTYILMRLRYAVMTGKTPDTVICSHDFMAGTAMTGADRRQLFSAIGRRS